MTGPLSAISEEERQRRQGGAGSTVARYEADRLEEMALGTLKARLAYARAEVARLEAAIYSKEVADE